MVNVFGVELAMSRVRLGVDASVWNVIPSSLGLISEQDVATVVPFEPSPHLLRERPNVMVVWPFMKPVAEWPLKIASMRIDMLTKLTLESWDHVVELESVRRQMDPSGMRSEDSERLSRPQSVGRFPRSDIHVSLIHILPQVVDIGFPND